MSQETPLSSFCDSMSSQCEQSYKDCEDSIRQSPIPSVLAAAGIGYILCLLPLGLILRAILKGRPRACKTSVAGAGDPQDRRALSLCEKVPVERA